MTVHERIADAAVDLVAELSVVNLPPRATAAYRRLRDEIQALRGGRLACCTYCHTGGHNRQNCQKRAADRLTKARGLG